MYIDPEGTAWYHWAIAGGVVVLLGIAVVATAGGAAPAIAAVLAVGNGMAAATTASTIAAGAFIGGSLALGSMAYMAGSSSNSVDEFYDQGDWGTVAGTVGGAAVGGVQGYLMARTQISSAPKNKGTFLPDSHYSKDSSMVGTPNTKYDHYKFNTHTRQYEKSTVYYDYAGRQSIRIDWTNHGRVDHGNPHVHFRIYDSENIYGKKYKWD